MGLWFIDHMNKMGLTVVEPPIVTVQNLMMAACDMLYESAEKSSHVPHVLNRGPFYESHIP